MRGRGIIEWADADADRTRCDWIELPESTGSVWVHWVVSGQSFSAPAWTVAVIEWERRP